ncbi:LamG domain-containing protein [Candidatus Beckwithbacteria bacterium]|nr:LamG domain-containing protein [Candidatus Beckwithbacteria bacterium]
MAFSKFIRLAIAFFIFSIFSITLPSKTYAWWDTDWHYRFKYTIDNSGVGEDLSNFPLHIALTNDTPAGFWTHVNANGYDIRIIDEDDSTNLTSYAHLEGWSSASSKGHLWVKKTVQSSTNDSDEFVWIYYGNSSISSSPFSDTTKQNTYNSNYVGVWHLDETSGTHYDATSNNNDSSSVSVLTQGSAIGMIDGADSFNGSSNYISTTASLNWTSTNAFSFCGWFNFANSTTGYMLATSNTVGSGALISSLSKDSYESGKVSFIVGKQGTGQSHIESSISYQTDQWEYYCGVYDGSDNMYLYRNGVLVGSGSYINGSATSNGSGFYMMYENNNSNYVNGKLDDVKIYNNAFSSEWIEYAYKSDGGTGGTGGTEEEKYFIEDVPSGLSVLSSSNWSTNLTTTGAHDMTGVGIKNSSYRIATFNVDFEANYSWTSLTAGADSTTAFFHYPGGITEMPGVASTTYTLYVPRNGKQMLLLCPGAESLEDVTPGCTNGYYLNANDSNVTVNTEDGTEYFKVSGLTSTGGKGVDPSMTFTIEEVASGVVTNGMTTNEASTYDTLPFGNLSAGEQKILAHKLTVDTNAPNGYSVNMKLLYGNLQGIYPDNYISPFAKTGVTWTNPLTWQSPTGTTSNVNSGWFGANTSDTRVSGWSSGSGKYGPVSTVSHTVMESSEADEGTSVYVTYSLEVNVYQHADLYSGTLVYEILPQY